MAFHLLNGMDAAGIHAEMMRTFRVSKVQAVTDLIAFREKFEPIIDPLADACPICDLDLEIIEPFSKPPSLPYRMDLALTYRCNNACLHCYNDPHRKPDELDSAAWKQMLDKLWRDRHPARGLHRRRADPAQGPARTGGIRRSNWAW